MKKVNLRDLYPDVYKNDHFVEVTEDVLETIQSAERAEAAYDRRMYRYKAYYSLDCDNGIENAILMKPQTPEMLLEEKQLREQLYAAVMALPEKQAKRIYARYYLGMRVSEIAAAEGLSLIHISASVTLRKKPTSRKSKPPCLGVTATRQKVTARKPSVWSVKPPNSAESTLTPWRT